MRFFQPQRREYRTQREFWAAWTVWSDRRKARKRERATKPVKRQRELAFLGLYFLACFDEGIIGKRRSAVTPGDLDRCALVAWAQVPTQSGRKRKVSLPNGEVNPPALKKAHELRMLPRIQMALDQMCIEVDMSMHECLTRLNELMRQGEDLAVALKAIDMRIKLTYGYAPTQRQQMNVNVSGDKLFEKSEFEKPAGIDLGDGQEMITP